MNAKEFEQLIPDYVLGKLSREERVAFENYLAKHPDAINEWKDIQSFLNMDEEETSSSMDTRFYDMLASETNANDVVKVRSLNPSKSNYLRVLIPLVAASLMLFFGFYMGKNSANTGTKDQPLVNVESVEDYKEETDALRTQLVMTLADESSATKRLQALSEASKLDNATEQVILALFKMLNEDTNVNVRLAAVASLSKYVDNPKVRQGLVMSITKQESPLVQIALADLMVTLKEQKSIDSMETLLQKPDINSAVKQKLEQSIKEII